MRRRGDGGWCGRECVDVCVCRQVQGERMDLMVLVGWVVGVAGGRFGGILNGCDVSVVELGSDIR